MDICGLCGYPHAMGCAPKTVPREKFDELFESHCRLGKQRDELFLQNDQMRSALDSILFCWSELKAATEANVPSGEFREDDERGERVRVCELNLRMALDRNEK